MKNPIKMDDLVFFPKFLETLELFGTLCSPSSMHNQQVTRFSAAREHAFRHGNSVTRSQVHIG